jgi:uncharacterized protein YukE
VTPVGAVLESGEKFGMSLFDKVSAVVGKVGHAVKAVAAPVVSAAKHVVTESWNAITDVWHGYFGSPVSGPTNWNVYSHEDMYAMVRSAGADPGQVGAQSFAVGQLARSARETTDEMRRQCRDLRSFWRGTASGGAMDLMDRHHQGGEETTTFVSSVVKAMDRAAEALSEAQRTMPKPVPVGEISHVGGKIGGSVASTAAPGFSGVAKAVGNVIGSSASGFAASAVSAQKKAQAVAVMQRYEKGLRDAEALIVMPAMLPPRADGQADSTNLLGGGQLPVDPSAMPRSVGRTTSVSASGAGNDQRHGSAYQGRPVPAGTHGQVPTVSGPPNQNPFVQGPSVVPMDPPRVSTVTGLASAVSPAPEGLSGSPGGVGLDGRTAGSPTPWRELVGNRSGAGLLPPGLSGGGLGSRPGAGPRAVAGSGRGAPGPLGASGAGGRSAEEQDAEHRNKMPHNHDLFATGDLDVPPPVIGA